MQSWPGEHDWEESRKAGGWLGWIETHWVEKAGAYLPVSDPLRTKKCIKRLFICLKVKQSLRAKAVAFAGAESWPAQPAIASSCFQSFVWS